MSCCGSFCRSSDPTWKIGKYLSATFPILWCLILPPLMLYVGITYIYCEYIGPIWLIIFAILCYVNCILFGFYLWTKFYEVRICGLYIVSKTPLYIFYGFLFTFVCWWALGFGRIFSGGKIAAQNIRHGINGSRGILDENWMDDPTCKKWLYVFPFWLTLTPFMIFGIFFIFLLIAAACGMCSDCIPEPTLTEEGRLTEEQIKMFSQKHKQTDLPE